MERQSIFSGETLQKIQKTRKIFLKFAVGILIAELVLGAILILVGDWNIALIKIQGTFLIFGLILFVSVNNFIRVEKGDRLTQIFALIGFFSNLFWGVFALLLLWEVTPFYTTTIANSRRMTFLAVAMLISAYAAGGGFWISNVMSIKETIKSVKPLKITAIVCMAYLWVFETFVALIQPEPKGIERLQQLAGLATIAFEITALAALIISKTNKKRESESRPAQFTPKTEDELRREIEEKVRREMMEKEVRAKMAAEQENANNSSSNTDGDTQQH